MFDSPIPSSPCRRHRMIRRAAAVALSALLALPAAAQTVVRPNTPPGGIIKPEDFDPLTASKLDTSRLGKPGGVPQLGDGVAAVPIVGPYTFGAGELYGMRLGNTSVLGSAILQGIIGAGATQADMMQTVQIIPPGTSITQTHGYASYVRNLNPANGGQGYALNFGAFADAVVDGAKVEAFNIAQTDSGAAGSLGRLLAGVEYDANVRHANSMAIGFSCTGASSVQPIYAACVQVGGLGAAVWPAALDVLDGAAAVALRSGLAVASGANVNSQPVRLVSTGADGAKHAVDLISTGGTTLALTGDQGVANLMMPIGNITLGSNGSGANTLSFPVAFRSNDGSGTAHDVAFQAANGRTLSLQGSGGADLTVGNGWFAAGVNINWAAAGSDQGGAAAITRNWVFVSTTPPGTGVRLPAVSGLPSGVGTEIVAWNNGANAMKLYPGFDNTLIGNPVNTPVTVASGAQVRCWWPGAGTTWICRAA